MAKSRKNYRGVTSRGNSIQICFTFHGRRRETLDLEPTAAHLKYADILRRNIKDAITLGKFTLEDYARHFPNSEWLRKNKKKVTNKYTVTDILNEWFSLIKGTKKPTTIRCYKGAIDQFINEFGPFPVPDLTSIEIKKWIASQQGQGITIKTIRNKIIPLRCALDHAVEAKIIEFNPFDMIKEIVPTESELIRRLQNKTIDPFDIDEVSDIILAAKKSDPQLWNLIDTGFWAGMRLGELFALAYEDIDFKKGRARVCRGVTEGKMGTLKTSKSILEHEIDLLPQALNAIKRQKQYTYMKPAIDCGDFGELHLVFYNPRQNRPWLRSLELIQSYWKQLLRKADVRYRYPYQMRHTFASILLSIGYPDTWVAEQMGHTTTAMVAKHYAKWKKKAAKMAGFDPQQQIDTILETYNKKIHAK